MSQWIKCSERMPEEGGVYLITVELHGERKRVIDRYYKATNRWYSFDIKTVIAWQNAPEIYDGAP